MPTTKNRPTCFLGRLRPATIASRDARQGAEAVGDVLPLVGDGDELSLLREIQRSFAIKLPLDLSNCHTVGDLHRVLLQCVPHAERGTTGLLVAKSYFALRRAVRKHDPRHVIRPNTQLTSIFASRRGAHRWRRQLKLDTGLEMPGLTLGAGASFLFLSAIGLPLGGYALHGATAALFALPISLLLLMLVQYLARFPATLRTVGDLAHAVAALNVAALSPPNEPLREREIWSALVGIVRYDIGWSGPVLSTTRFFSDN
jgi:hypothetical protein